jgi:hypothetical protein
VSDQSILGTFTCPMTLHVDLDVVLFIRRSDDDLKQKFRRCLMNGWNCVKMLMIFVLHRSDGLAWVKDSDWANGCSVLLQLT